MIDDRLIQAEAEINPYKKLLGAVFRQVIEEAVWARYYRKLWREYKADPDSYSKHRKYWLEKKVREVNSARYFIFSKQLERSFKFWKMDISPTYFRTKFLKLEALVIRSGEKPGSELLPVA